MTRMSRVAATFDRAIPTTGVALAWTGLGFNVLAGIEWILGHSYLTSACLAAGFVLLVAALAAEWLRRHGTSGLRHVASRAAWWVTVLSGAVIVAALVTGWRHLAYWLAVLAVLSFGAHLGLARTGDES
jgi:hypothetical protein